ncbi:AsmA-like C-terminal region-containing protein [Fluviicola taffensis]|uniref:AsmA family protein n=1 Tax=Fluviicola taffensis (strain DSM 16823 / NCIMB 13979 / RW262) TaxID=755732 RepID=F2IBA1_FLUTR|nr:AsmA-like C-terminal region-containing protein [Fluviicola taffensis]AEA43187.1 AsmA family protein [Fluviicola taffensis DSM 16823]
MSKKEKLPKKKKSFIRRLFKWTGITILFLIIAIILIPIIFKDEIKELVLKEVSKSLKADVTIEDFDLTFLSTFPNVTIQLYDTKVTGRTEFKGVELANIKTIEAHVGLWDVIGGDEIEIDEVHISDAKFDVRVDPAGKANYDIVIPEDEKPVADQGPSKFKMSLKEYSLNNIQLVFDDQASDMYANIKNLNHTGEGDLTADIIDFETSTKIDEVTLEMDGLSYLSKVKTDADVNLLMEFKEDDSKFTLKDNSFALNNFHMSLDGFYQMLKDHSQMDLKLNTKEISFKDLLSLVPSFYQSGYESMIAKGDLKMNGEVKGRMDDKNMPGWDFGLNVKNASIRYPALPGSINNIIVDAGSKFAGGSNLDLMTLDVTKFHSEFVGNLIDANLKLRNPMTDPLIDSKLKAKVNLATLGKVMPLAEGESYKGKLNADVALNGRMSAIETEQYEKFNAQGLIELFDFLYKSKDLNEDVNVKDLTFRFSPQNLSLEKMNARMGKSDFAMNGKIDNYLGYLFGKKKEDQLLKGVFAFNSNNLDLDQLMGASTAPSAATTSAEPAPVDPNTEPLLIPDNIDFDLNTNIQKLHYNGIDVNNIKGNVNMKEEVASLNGLSMNTMGGTVGLRGSYSSKDHNKPAIDLGYNLKEIDIQEITTHFLTIEKLAPVAKYAKGKFSSSLNLKGDLTKALEPVYNSLTGDGDLFTNLVTVSGFEPLKKLGESLNMDKLSNQTFKDVKAFFSFADGKVTMKKPLKIKMSGIDTEITGSTAFTQEIDYKMLMQVPKSMIPAGIIKVAEQGLAKVNGLVPKLNIGSIPDIIPVNALVGGTVMKPVIKTDFKEALLKATGNLKNTIQDKGKELVNKAKDSVRTVVKEKVEEVKKDLIAEKNKIMADAEKEADKVRAEAKKGGDQLRAEADKQCNDAMTAAGSNPLKKKAAEIACKEGKKKADNSITKLEQEANTKADNIIVKAKEKADAVK